MKEQIENAIEILKKQNIEGCITGSCLLDYFEDQDVDLFCYNEHSFRKLINFLHYSPLFLILDKLEEHKFNEYIDKGKSSLDKIGLISIKFKYNLCVDINIIYKKYQRDCFSVITNFDLDIIAVGYNIKTGKTLSLRESEGMDCNWNTWNDDFYNPDLWSVKRIIRQFERVIKYTNRGYNLERVIDKYISMVEDIINLDNIYKTERGTEFYESTQKQFKIVIEILETWKKDKKITDNELRIIKTII